MHYSTLLRTLVLFFLVIGLRIQLAHAQPVENDWEIQGSANFFHTQDSHTGTVTADGALGYFLTDELEVGVRQTISSAFIRHARDQWLATSAGFSDYNFHGLVNEDWIIPYLGAFVGAVWNDQDSTGTLGPNAGTKFFLSRRTSINAAYRYEWYFDKVNTKDIRENSDHGNHVATLGLTYVWGGDDNRRGRF